MKRKSYVIYDNYNVNKDDFRESWEENGSLGDLYEYAVDSLNLYWDDLKDNLTYSKECQDPCVITGRLGLWNGRHIIEPVVCSNVLEAINNCIGRSIDYIIINKVNGHLEVDAIHHDGSNQLEIHKLNDRGVNAGDKADLSNRVYHKAYSEYLF